MDNSYKHKYLKYKTKYFQSRNQNGGGLFDWFQGSSAPSSSCQTLFTKGTEGEKNYQIFIGYSVSSNKVKILSPFHGINLFPNFDQPDIVNMVIEIPKGRQEKMEIYKHASFNPIEYDIKDNKVRRVTYKAKGAEQSGYPFHYGALPMTWEHAGMKDSRTGAFGDNDPIDAFDISNNPATPGTVRQIKVLGAFAMLDAGETDWKLVCIDVNDEKSNQYDDLKDVPKNILDTIEDFLTNYKTPDGKPPNKFAEKKLWNKQESLTIIKDVHHHWAELIMNKTKVVGDTKISRPDSETDVQLIHLVAEQVLDRSYFN